MSNLKGELLANQLAKGFQFSQCSSGIEEIMVRAGFDWMAVDLEHIAITLRQADQLIKVIDLRQVSSLVRMTFSDRDQFKQVMDAFEHGAIVPMVNTQTDAKRNQISRLVRMRRFRGLPTKGQQ